MAVGVVFALFFVAFGLGLPILRWLLIEGETDEDDVVDREAAAAAAREQYRRQHRARGAADDE